MIIQILILILLILVNGLFSGSEVAFLSIDKIKLLEDSKKNKKAALTSTLLDDTNRFLATIQVVITFAGFLASAFAADVFTEYFIKIFNLENVVYAEGLLLVIITMLLSYFTLVFGELLPKKIALSNPNKIAYETSYILYYSRKIFHPFVVILTKSVNILTKLLHIKETKENDLTEERIKRVIGLGKEEGILEVQESEILLSVFEFNDTTAKEAMTKISDSYIINVTDNKQAIIDVVKKSKHTRFPVYKNDKLIGILNIKDLILNNDKNFLDILRKPIFVKPEDKIDDIFKKMKKENTGMMIVKSNIVEGIITTEDIIEELVGNISDEFN